jgi:ABC-type branched-subunit amino acid transport system substrate-binding protein
VSPTLRAFVALAIATALTVVLAATAMTAGAQSGDSSTSTTTAPTATTAPGSAGAPTSRPAAGATRGVTATSIKVAGLGDAALYGGADVGARARFQRANDAGGVNGRTIEYGGFTDDGGDPAAGTTAATKLVDDNQVFAVVPTVTPDLAASKFLVQQKVPYFGWALSSDFCGNAYGFGFTGCLLPEDVTSNAWGVLVRKVFGAQSSGRTAAIVTENSPYGQYEVKALTAGVTSARIKVVYEKASLGLPATADFNALAKEVLASNNGKSPDSVFVVGNVSNVLGMQNALRDAGFLAIFTNQLEYAPNLVAPAIGAMVVTQSAPVESASTNKAMAQLVTDVQKVAPNQPIDQSVIAGYWSADLFLAAVKRAGKNLTAASLLKAANRNFTYQVKDTVGPTVFPAAHSVPTPCGALVGTNGTAYAVKVPYTCGRVVPVK